MTRLYNSLIEHLSHECRVFAPDRKFFIRKLGRGAFLNRVIPNSTLSLSLTGNKCELKCSHCEGHYLKGMKDIYNLSAEDFKDYESVLISGGSDRDGSVPIDRYQHEILKIPEDLTINFHVGYQNPKCLEKFSSRKFIVSFDIPTSDEVISNVFHLPYTASDYRNQYLDYAKKYKTVPHITIGLEKINSKGEEDTIDFLELNPPEQLVLIVFRPTKGTSLESQEVPTIARVVDLIKYAIKKLPGAIKLGCMRPSGEYRKNLDILAWMHGLKTIVLPHKSLLKILNENKIVIKDSYECCALG